MLFLFCVFFLLFYGMPFRITIYHFVYWWFIVWPLCVARQVVGVWFVLLCTGTINTIVDNWKRHRVCRQALLPSLVQFFLVVLSKGCCRAVSCHWLLWVFGVVHSGGG